MDPREVDAARSEFPGASVGVAGEGQLCIALLVDDLIVRYPRHAFGVGRLRFEVDLLEAIRPHLTTTVPTVVRVELDRPVGEAFVAHGALTGTVLTAEILTMMPTADMSRVAGHVAAFMSELHDLRDLARAHGVPKRSPAMFAAELAAEVAELLADRMTPLARDRARRELDALAALGDDVSALCHTDIGGNILFDESNGDVAIIDFGSCFVTDPAFDVASLSVLGEEFVLECARRDPRIAEARLAAPVLRRTFALQDALYGARQGDWDHVDRVLRSYA